MDKIYPIIGMSPGNSYFKDKEVRYLLQKVIAQFGRVAILIADIPAISTYQALGYPDNKAKSKAVSKGNNLKNRVQRLQQELNIPNDKIRIIQWEEEIKDNTKYQEAYQKITKLYKENKEFRQAAQETTRSVLINSNKEITNLDQAIETAVHYLLSELAFLEFAPDFLHCQSVTYVYHRNWPTYQKYAAGIFDTKKRDYLNFLLLENPYETFIPLQRGSDKKIRASYSHYPPAFIKDGNKYSGIFYEVLNKFAKELGIGIDWVEETGYGVIIDGLNDERFNIFTSTVWPTPERLSQADFSISLYESRTEMWAQKEYSTEQLQKQDFTIAIKENDISHSIAKADFPKAKLVRIPQLGSMDDLLNMVVSGVAQATFAEPYIVNDFNKRYSTKLIPIKAVSPIRKYPNTFMVKKGENKLLPELNKFIKKLQQSGDINNLLKKYLFHN